MRRDSKRTGGGYCDGTLRGYCLRPWSASLPTLGDTHPLRIAAPPTHTKSPATRLKNPPRRGGAAQDRATSLAIAAMQALAFDPG